MTVDLDRRAALEAAIDAHPDQADNYLVLADWLQEHQDPRGELIVLSRNKDRDSKARCAVLQKQIGPPMPPAAWFYGFVRSLRSYGSEDDAGELRATLDHPSLRHVTSVACDIPGNQWDDRQWIIALIAERPRLCLRSLEIRSFLRGGNEPPAGDLELEPLSTALPRLTTLRVSARCIDPGGLASSTLETLELDGEVTASSLGPLLASCCPKLRELVLTDVDGAFGNALADSPLATQLRKLTLPFVEPADRPALERAVPGVTFLPAPDGDRYEQIGE